MSKEKNIKIYQPFINEPPVNEINISEFEDILEYDSKIDNIINTGAKRNIQIEIDSYKDQTLIYNILDKYIGVGLDNLKDIPELNKRQGQYMDISKLPNNIHDLKKLSLEAQQKLIELEKLELEKNNKKEGINNVENNLQNQTLDNNEKNLSNAEKTKQTNQKNQ